jgi:hypothetical protein
MAQAVLNSACVCASNPYEDNLAVDMDLSAVGSVRIRKISISVTLLSLRPIRSEKAFCAHYWCAKGF